MHYVWLILCIPASLFGAYRSLRLFISLLAQNESNRNKDFEVCYCPLVSSTFFMCLATFFVKAIAGSKMVESCNESLMQFSFSLIGGAMLQVAINWLEVAGKEILFKIH